MRTLSLTAYELHVGHLVLRIGDKDFNSPLPVLMCRWVKDDMAVTLMMDNGQVTLYLPSDTPVDVVHPEQDPLYELDDLDEDWSVGDGYNEWKTDGGA